MYPGCKNKKTGVRERSEAVKERTTATNLNHLVHDALHDMLLFVNRRRHMRRLTPKTRMILHEKKKNMRQRAEKRQKIDEITEKREHDMT